MSVRVALGVRLGLGMTLLLCGCHRGSELEAPVAGFAVNPPSLDFGRVLQGKSAEQTIEIANTGRTDLSLTTTAPPAFYIQTPIAVPSGTRTAVPILFNAGASAVAGAVTFRSGGLSQQAQVSGIGVAPLPCVPSAVCRLSTFDVQSGQCVETVTPDDAGCVPTDVCQQDGVCRGGLCRGVLRNCDDGNACTNDACAEGIGCIHTPVFCPRPSAACKVATCDPTSGCGVGDAFNGSSCGALNCTTEQICRDGTCVTTATPDGTLCFPPTPCQGPGLCQARTCVRPDAGPLTPTLRWSLGADAVVGLTAASGALYLNTCGTDGGCSTRSWTENGFQRWISADSGFAQSVAITDAGVWTKSSPTVLSLASSASGALLATIDLAASFDAGALLALRREAVTAPDDDSLWLALDVDGGPSVLVRATSAGISLLGGIASGATLATDRTGAVLLDESGSVSRLGWIDGGLQRDFAFAGASASLISGGDRVLSGRSLWSLDGGRVATLPTATDGGSTIGWDPRWSVLATDAGFAIGWTCEPPQLDGCAASDQTPSVHAFDPLSGIDLWSLPIASPDAGSFIAALVAVEGGGVLTFTESSAANGRREDLQLLGAGTQLFECSMAPGAQLGAATFADSSLYAAVLRDGGWELDAFDLSPLPLDFSGWAAPDGIAGTRRGH